jgi:hypothetical protein
MAADRTETIQPSISQPRQPVSIHEFRPARFPAAPTEMSPAISALLLRLRTEYREMPGLNLTEAQARRLWSLDGHTCRVVLTMLLEQRSLRRTASGTYVRATG